MTTRKRPISLERHREIGLELFAMEDRLLALRGELWRSLSLNGRAAGAAEQAISRISKLRLALEGDALRQFNGEDHGLYFGSRVAHAHDAAKAKASAARVLAAARAATHPLDDKESPI